MEFGAGTLVYGMAAGAPAAIAFVFVSIALRRGNNDPVLLAFGAVGLSSALATIIAVRLHASSEVDEYADLLKSFGLLSLVLLVAFVILVVVWTRGAPRWLVIAFLSASAIVAVLHAAVPDGLLAANVTSLREVELLGERFVVHEAGTSPWRPVLDAYLVLAGVVIGTALIRSFRTIPRAVALVLTGSVGMVVVFGVYDSLVDRGLVSTPYLAPLATAAVVAMAASYLGLQLADTERRLQQQNALLEEAVLARTAALVETNRRLETTVARQRSSVRRLAALARRFETMNAVTLSGPDRRRIVDTLEGVLAELGQLVGAEHVALRLVDLDEVPIDRPIEWSAAEGEPVDGTAAVIVAPLTVSGRKLGELSVRPGADAIGPERRRYIDLVVEHLAGFVERVDLAGRIASAAVLAERRRIAQELHDSVTQKLYSVSFLTEALPGHLTGETGDTDEAGRIVRRMREILLTSLAELRTLMFELHPAALERTELPQLLEQLCEMVDAGGPVDIELSTTTGPRVPTPVRIGLYRIAQEALTNVARHSGAGSARVTLRHLHPGVELGVRDDGRGFDPTGAHVGHGLLNMRERARSIGAELSIESSPTEGTVLVARWIGTNHEPAADDRTATHDGTATDDGTDAPVGPMERAR